MAAPARDSSGFDAFLRGAVALPRMRPEPTAYYRGVNGKPARDVLSWPGCCFSAAETGRPAGLRDCRAQRDFTNTGRSRRPISRPPEARWDANWRQPFCACTPVQVATAYRHWQHCPVGAAAGGKAPGIAWGRRLNIIAWRLLQYRARRSPWASPV